MGGDPHPPAQGPANVFSEGPRVNMAGSVAMRSALPPLRSALVESEQPWADELAALITLCLQAHGVALGGGLSPPNLRSDEGTRALL